MRKYLLFIVCVLFADGGVQSFNVHETAETIRAEGYYVETHYVTTSDGYILQVERIPFPRHQNSSDNPNRPVVFVMHGLLAGSNSFIILGPEYSLAYNLADAGYDVWMGNARGNRFSRVHVSLDPDDDKEKFKFFDFSWEEIGRIDAPAMIDYALNHTGQKKLHYIGHSQGGTSFLVMCSMRPEYNEKMASVNLLAAVGYMKHFPNSDLAGLAVLSDVIYTLALSIGFVELYPPNPTSLVADTRSSGTLRNPASCLGDSKYSYMCEMMGVQHILTDDTHFDTNDISSIFNEYEAAGASIKQITHYAQNIRDKTFRRWNYGLLQNLLVYKSAYPPAYNLGVITAPVTMHYTINDNLLDERDVLAMADDMPNAKVRKVENDDFLHEDFVAAKDSKVLVNNYIIKDIGESSEHSTSASTGEDIVKVDTGENAFIEDVLSGRNNIIEELQLKRLTNSASNVLLSFALSFYLVIYTLHLVF